VLAAPFFKAIVRIRVFCLENVAVRLVQLYGSKAKCLFAGDSPLLDWRGFVAFEIEPPFAVGVEDTVRELAAPVGVVFWRRSVFRVVLEMGHAVFVGRVDLVETVGSFIAGLWFDFVGVVK
jgi:hypothetical protein